MPCSTIRPAALTGNGARTIRRGKSWRNKALRWTMPLFRLQYGIPKRTCSNISVGWARSPPRHPIMLRRFLRLRRKKDPMKPPSSQQSQPQPQDQEAEPDQETEDQAPYQPWAEDPDPVEVMTPEQIDRAVANTKARMEGRPMPNPMPVSEDDDEPEEPLDREDRMRDEGLRPERPRRSRSGSGANDRRQSRQVRGRRRGSPFRLPPPLRCRRRSAYRRSTS